MISYDIVYRSIGGLRALRAGLGDNDLLIRRLFKSSGLERMSSFPDLTDQLNPTYAFNEDIGRKHLKREPGRVDACSDH